MTALSNFLQTDIISLSSCLFLLASLLIYKLFWDGVHMKIIGILKPRPNLSHIDKYMDDLQPTPMASPSPTSPASEMFSNFNPESYKEFQKQLLIDSNYELVEKP